MSTKTITALTAAGVDDVTVNDVLIVVDVEDTTGSAEGTTKKVSLARFCLQDAQSRAVSEGYVLSDGPVDLGASSPVTLDADTHNGKMLVWDNAGALVLNVPTGLPDGFSCGLIQAGAGAATFTAVGTTLRQKDSAYATDGQWSAASLYHLGSDEFHLTGDLA